MSRKYVNEQEYAAAMARELRLRLRAQYAADTATAIAREYGDRRSGKSVTEQVYETLRKKAATQENQMMLTGGSVDGHQLLLGREKAQMGEQRIMVSPDRGKPMVSREDYEKAREVLDALPPGIYLHCSRCGQWQRGGEVTLKEGHQLCEKCA